MSGPGRSWTVWKAPKMDALKWELPSLGPPPFHQGCSCILVDGKVSVGGACAGEGCDCRALEGVALDSDEALSWLAKRSTF